MWLWILACFASAAELDFDISADDFVLTAETERGVRRLTDRMFTTYDDVLGLSFPARLQMSVRLVEDRTEYEKLAGALGRTGPTLGFFSTRTGKGVVWRQSDEAETRSTLVHEASHFLMVRGGATTAPRWLHEGMAMLFEGARLSGNAVYLDPPPGIAGLMKALGARVPSAADLLRDPSAFQRIPAPGGAPPADYTVGWSLCAFLMQSDRGKRVLATLLRTPPGPRMVAVLDAEWPGGSAAFDRQWRASWARPRTLQLPIRTAPTKTDGGWIRCDNGSLIRQGSGLQCPKAR